MVTLYVQCLSCYHTHVIFDYVHPLMELIRVNSRTALSKVKTIMCYGRTPSLPFILYSLLIIILTRTDLAHSHMPNSTVLQYTHCAVMHARLHHGVESENNFRLTITWNFICFYNSNKRGHAILLKSQYYSTPAASRFRSHWSIIREHKVVPTFI